MSTLKTIDELAVRIERAYLRRRTRWRQGCSNPGIWSAAAAALWQLHESDPSIPADPELFVVAQPAASPLDDPWQMLTQPAAARRYRRRVRQIVRRLREELRGEVRSAEARLGLGTPIEAVLRSRARWLSPLGRIIVAHRAGRPELAGPWLVSARNQHRSCPLYRQACLHFLPVGTYPADEPPTGLSHSPGPAPEASVFSVN